jgi:hypothetical protein
MQVKVRLGELFLQAFDKVTVKLNGVKALAVIDQLPGDCTKARSDLNQVLVGSGGDALHDMSNDLLVLQKILAKPFSGLMIQSVNSGQPIQAGNYKLPRVKPWCFP